MILFAILIILIGIDICYNPILYSGRTGMTYDFTGINIPVGLILIAWGVSILWGYSKKK